VEITYRQSEIIRFRDVASDFRWIDVKHFDTVGTGNHKDALAAVIANEWYNDDYASPSGALPEPSRGLHGPYSLDSISVASFEKISPRKVRDAVRKWAAALGPLPVEFVRRYEDLLTELLKDASAVFRLADLDDSARHQWDGHLGVLGFHEFVILSPSVKTIALVVASDD
jgi:hypothetical protein